MSSVDVVVPCFRYGRFLRECVESVLTQSGPELRVLIIDDASPDNTAEVAEGLVCSDPRVSYCRHTSNQGLIATANEGIAWARADYMLLLSADDYLLPGALSRSVELMDDHPSVAFTFGGAVVLDQHGERSRRRTGVGSRTRVLSGLDFIALSGAKNIVLSPTVVVRTCLQKRGGYLADLPYASDMEMWLRLAAHGDVGVIAADQAVYRAHSANMSSEPSREQDLLQRKAAIEHFLDSSAARFTNAADLRIRMNHMLALEAIGCASAAFNEGAMESSARLSKLALSIDPSVQRSRRWWFLACKKVLGSREWQLVRPAVEWFRSIVRKDHR
ncbi:MULTISPECIES: glycosyltransferase [unclassified Bradyrhizobium]|uniref:glycosyltransferase family 2 protein n=1 Tax=unclassified Bradyrhizobium TaxID=2631580 RepID=UPI0004764DCE|nr:MULTISPECIES: glycosyltransferase [unclassified Bradyrhizobium]MCK1354934.1 glycosyltransferase [Bradyrhizobium sp. CW7]MCK1496927.1 glycosyltransferase [Bradyrhizobium sp. 188]MCK1550635.1 glycosyltransferase [Bradyrhizobium sp. 177]MCK1568454.1 glycosyltransferase [Bradyrhizobium sp. 173]MCK1575024.1 glycosyltransferase [Bradyrhizobium sp. 174]